MELDQLQCRVVQRLKQHHEKLNDYTDSELVSMVFKNSLSRYNQYAVKQVGWRLSDYGNVLMMPVYDHYDFGIQEQNVTNNLILKMNRITTWPYYLGRKQLVFYSKDDAMWFKLYGYDLEKYVKALENE